MPVRLSISNIAWDKAMDSHVYEMMKNAGYSGLEIAPTRAFPDSPYERIAEAKTWGSELYRDYGFVISSMQSIWYGRTERVFGSREERDILLNYTKKAVQFAAALKCENLVFGCPKNRCIPEGTAPEEAIPFFRELGDYAAALGVVIGLEANPPIYQTNFINDTASALEFIRAVNSEGFRLNLDVGTMIQNGEDVSILAGQCTLINHVHISEPFLKPIQRRDLHQALRDVLMKEGYRKCVSIEMAKRDDPYFLQDALSYISELFLRDGGNQHEL